MKQLSRDKSNLVYTHSAAHQPKLRVRPGERFQVETELHNGDWLQGLDDSPLGRADQFPYLNPTAGPVYIEGANPGDALRVYVEKINLDEIGYCRISPSDEPCLNWCGQDDWSDQFRVVRVSDGVVHWSDKVKLPIQPMIGTIGTKRYNSKNPRRTGFVVFLFVFFTESFFVLQEKTSFCLSSTILKGFGSMDK